MTLRRRRATGGGGERARSGADPFPHLRAFLGGYLHQDFLLDHTSAAEALRAFLTEADAAERQALRDDWRAFRTAVEGARWRDVRERFAELGGAWLPASRRALLSLFAEFDRP